MLCPTCIHKEVCEGLFPAEKQECKRYHGTCKDCEHICYHDAIHYDPNEYCSKWSKRNEGEDN